MPRVSPLHPLHSHLLCVLHLPYYCLTAAGRVLLVKAAGHSEHLLYKLLSTAMLLLLFRRVHTIPMY